MWKTISSFLERGHKKVDFIQTLIIHFNFFSKFGFSFKLQKLLLNINSILHQIFLQDENSSTSKSKAITITGPILSKRRWKWKNQLKILSPQKIVPCKSCFYFNKYAVFHCKLYSLYWVIRICIFNIISM